MPSASRLWAHSVCVVCLWMTRRVRRELTQTQTPSRVGVERDGRMADTDTDNTRDGHCGSTGGGGCSLFVREWRWMAASPRRVVGRPSPAVVSSQLRAGARAAGRGAETSTGRGQPVGRRPDRRASKNSPLALRRPQTSNRRTRTELGFRPAAPTCSPPPHSTPLNAACRPERHVPAQRAVSRELTVLQICCAPTASLVGVDS